ncbi:MAG: hypothetical protein GY863_10015 [bacterium]|nr:hypothetical protein [bacterium]
MSLDNLFSTKGDTIDLQGIESLKKLCKYHPVKANIFFDGLELAEDLCGLKGVTLYTAGTPISRDRVTRLINLTESNKEWILKFKIKRSAKLLQNFKTDIEKKLTKMIEHRKNFKVYNNLLGAINEEVETLVEGMFEDEEILLSVFKMKFTADSSTNKNAAMFFNHTISVALFSFAISKTPELTEAAQFSKDDQISLIKAAFFHNMGALCNVDSILAVEESLRRAKYNEYNKQSGMMLTELKLNFDIMDAIRYIGEYHDDRMDFVTREDNKGCWIANILLAADKYAQDESGLFGAHYKPSRIVDQLNVAGMNGKLNGTVVKALTLGLNLKDVFDFYQEIDRLNNLCNFDGGKHATAYPMTGFKSPTLFICKKDKENCEFYEKSLKAVTLVKAMGNLDPGKYSRCMLTSPKLQEFYSEHYDDIKEDMKQSSKK